MFPVYMDKSDIVDAFTCMPAGTSNGVAWSPYPPFIIHTNRIL